MIPKFGKLPATLRNNAGEGPLRIARLQNPAAAKPNRPAIAWARTAVAMLAGTGLKRWS